MKVTAFHTGHPVFSLKSMEQQHDQNFTGKAIKTKVKTKIVKNITEDF